MNQIDKLRPWIVSMLVVLGILLFADAEGFGQGNGKSKPEPKPAVSAPAITPSNPSKCPEPNGLNPAEIIEILAAHNAARSEEKLPSVTWDCRMAAFAQEWANKSVYEHRDNFSFGENIFVSGTSTEPIGSSVKRWMLEKASWTNQSATCAPGKHCLHYVQIMWRATKSVGCGINRAATGKWRSVVVCNYDPSSKPSGPAF